MPIEYGYSVSSPYMTTTFSYPQNSWTQQCHEMWSSTREHRSYMDSILRDMGMTVRFSASDKATS